MQCYRLCRHKEAGIFLSAVRSPDTRRFGSQCDVARRGQIEPRSQCSVAISADGWGWVWVNASSDLRSHLIHSESFLPPGPYFSIHTNRSLSSNTWILYSAKSEPIAHQFVESLKAPTMQP